MREPALPVALGAHPESLLLRRATADPSRTEVLRLWPAPARLEDGTALWVGRYEHMGARELVGVLNLWQPVPRPVPGELPDDLRAAFAAHGLVGGHGQLRLRIDAPAR